MSPSLFRPRRNAAGSACLAAAAAGSAAAFAAGCSDRLLNVTTPSRLTESTFLQAQNAPLITRSAQADFECALGAYVVASGLGSGELTDASQTASRWSYDRRDVLPGDALYATGPCDAVGLGLGVYTPVSTARYTTDQALARLDQWTDAEVRAARSSSRAPPSTPGSPTCCSPRASARRRSISAPSCTTAQLLDSAEARFSRTISLSTARPTRPCSAPPTWAARGCGSTGGTPPARRTDAAQVPTSFVSRRRLTTTRPATEPGVRGEQQHDRRRRRSPTRTAPHGRRPA
jgi:hypothetical protein